MEKESTESTENETFQNLKMYSNKLINKENIYIETSKNPEHKFDRLESLTTEDSQINTNKEVEESTVKQNNVINLNLVSLEKESRNNVSNVEVCTKKECSQPDNIFGDKYQLTEQETLKVKDEKIDEEIKIKRKKGNKSQSKHACHFCEKVFRSRTDTKRHEISHTKIKEHSCEECGKQFAYKSDIPRHILTQHTKVPVMKLTVVCSECGKTFTNKNNLIIHERTHTGVKPFVCEVCEYSFRLECHLEKHRVTDHSLPYPKICDLCGKGFINFKFKRAWAFHKKKCGNEKVFIDSKISCEICDKEFHKRDAYNRHMKSHSKQKDFPCKLCVKTFADKRNLLAHTNNLHSKEKLLS
jgi:uncharacterized Zn-finger protein